MKNLQLSTNLDDLTATVIGLGREIAEQAHALQLGRTSKDAAFVSRCLGLLRDREPLSASIEVGLDAVRDILERDIDGEKTGTEHRFVEIRFDEVGPLGENLEVPLYTHRGSDLLDLQKLFDRFIEARSLVLDRIAAHRALMAKMSG